MTELRRLQLRFRLTHAWKPCMAAYLGDCDGGVQVDHVIPKSRLKRRYADLHNPQGKPLDEIVWDPRNGRALCDKHHQLWTGRSRRLDRLPVPEEARVFAREYGLEHWLEEVPHVEGRAGP